MLSVGFLLGSILPDVCLLGSILSGGFLLGSILSGGFLLGSILLAAFFLALFYLGGFLPDSILPGGFLLGAGPHAGLGRHVGCPLPRNLHRHNESDKEDSYLSRE
jgi:hypothetical protein